MATSSACEWVVGWGCLQAMTIQLNIERQIPTAAIPTINTVADTRKPLLHQLGHICQRLTYMKVAIGITLIAVKIAMKV